MTGNSRRDRLCSSQEILDEHGLEDRNRKRHNKSWVINMDTESCVGRVQGRIGETKRQV